MKSLTTFSKNLKFLRRLRGLTQVQLAQDLDISRSKISAYEAGLSHPNLILLVRMAQLFDVRLSTLILEALDQKEIDIDIQSDEISTSYKLSQPDINRYIHTTNEAQKIMDGLKTMQEMELSVMTDTDGMGLRYFETLQLLLNNNWTFIKSMQAPIKKEDPQ